MNKTKSKYHGYIYLYINKINGKAYVGQTSNLRQRKYQHEQKSSVELVIDRAINKYGKQNFEFKVLVEITRSSYEEYKKDIDALEKFYIQKYKDDGFVMYNISEGGGNTWANYNSKREYGNLSEEQKQKISKSLHEYYKTHRGRDASGDKNAKSRKVEVIDLNTNQICKTYNCGKYACADLGINYSTFRYRMRRGGIQVNNFLYKWSCY